MYIYLFNKIKYFLLSFIMALIFSILLIVLNFFFPFLSQYELIGSNSIITSFLDKVWEFFDVNKFVDKNKLIEVCCLNSSVLHDIFITSLILFIVYTVYGFLMSKEKIFFIFDNPDKILIQGNKILRNSVNERYLNMHKLEYNLFFTNRYTYDIIIVTTIIYIFITLIHIYEYQNKIELSLIVMVIFILIMYGMIVKYIIRPILGKSIIINFFAKKIILNNFKSLYGLSKYYKIEDIEQILLHRLKCFPEITEKDIFN